MSMIEQPGPRRAQGPRVLRIIDKISDICAVGAAAAVVLLVLNVCIDVIGRKFFHAPFTGTLEMTAYWWMPMLTLLAFAYTEQRQEHIKVTILLDALPVRMRQLVEGSFGLIATVLLAALTYYTLMGALRAAEIGQTTASTPPVSVWPFKFVAVAGVAMLTLQVAATTYRHFAGLPARRRAPATETDFA